METHRILSTAHAGTAALLGAVLLVLTACGSGTSDDTETSADPAQTTDAGPPPTAPEEVVLAYYAADEAKDCAGIVANLSTSARERGVLCEEDELAAFDGPPMTVEIVDSVVREASATVTVNELRKFDYGEIDSIEVDVVLLVENGEWKINEFVSDY
ncbi:hypothetical protein [Nocardioides pelophilus]|uniref:hypothetical protein n=1 Tax=Nocardioides pelophilus TaxID=2172019 RepID=UPI0016016D8C|nr:hypothetical protein [Nocardioides pelophilus]